MADNTPTDHRGELEPFHPRPRSSRRKFLGLAAGGFAATAGFAGVYARDTSLSEAVENAVTADTSTTTTRPLIASEDVKGRTLVVIELQGGNDGLATVVPRNAGVLYDRRPDLHVADEELLDFTDDYGWNPRLAGIAGHGVAALVGLGTTTNPDGSHFEMERRWWAGKSNGNDLPATGFLGRLCDQLVEDQPVTGLSLGSGPSPALASANAVTVGMSDPEASWFLRSQDAWFTNLRRGLRDMAGTPGGAAVTSLSSARTGLNDTLAFADVLGEIDDERVRERYPNTNLSRSLGVAAQLIVQDAGLRVIHISHGGFDTHSGGRGEHDYLLEQLGEGMGAFLSDLGELGVADSTLVCTTSEFGRRVPQNGNGTDHGAAGLALLAGPVASGIHGEAPSLTDLHDDNLVATVDFEEYYATIAERWFGIHCGDVIDSAPAPIDGLITA